jgi:hypothetical protein
MSFEESIQDVGRRAVVPHEFFEGLVILVKHVISGVGGLDVS